MIWGGVLVSLLPQNNFNEEYYTKTIFTVSIYACFQGTVMRHDLCTMRDQSSSALCLGDLVASYRHVVIGHPIVSVLTQSCPYDT